MLLMAGRGPCRLPATLTGHNISTRLIAVISEAELSELDSSFFPLPLPSPSNMFRQALFGQQQRPQQFYTGNSQVVLDGAGLSDDDSFGGENLEINEVSCFSTSFR